MFAIELLRELACLLIAGLMKGNVLLYVLMALLAFVLAMVLFIHCVPGTYGG